MFTWWILYRSAWRKGLDYDQEVCSPNSLHHFNATERNSLKSKSIFKYSKILEWDKKEQNQALDYNCLSG